MQMPPDFPTHDILSGGFQVLMFVAIIEMRVKVGQLWKWRLDYIQRIERERDEFKVQAMKAGK